MTWVFGAFILAYSWTKSEAKGGNAMSAKRPDPDCENAYEAADLWIDRALKSDDSLFTPGTCIWSLEPLAEARALLENNADALKGSDFLGRLGKVMKDNGSPPKVYQLMGEAAYVAYLIVYKGTITQATKIANINRILGWSSERVRIPRRLHAGLENGIMSLGPRINLDRRLDAVIRLAEQWKRTGSNTMLDREATEAPWRFQKYLAELGIGDAWQVAPLHLVHPDTFEPLVWSNKVKVAKAPGFLGYLAGMTTGEVNRKIHRIRAKLEPEYGCCFHFIDCLPVCRMWSDDCKER